MTSTNTLAPATQRGGGLAEKRAAITRAALLVFGRDGYSRASINEIAKEAAVSTRTIYNHFSGKDELFRTVILESSERVRDAQLDILDRHAERRIADLEEELVALGRAWMQPMSRFPDHFALVRQVNAEAGHIPRDLLESWQDAGPRAAHAGLARHLETLAEQAPLDLRGDPGRAATHFTLLATTEVTNRSFYGAFPLDEADIAHSVAAGVRTFLSGYHRRDA